MLWSSISQATLFKTFETLYAWAMDVIEEFQSSENS